MPDIYETAEAMRAFALRLPGATEDFPWGDRVAKVNKKVFIFMGRADDMSDGLGFSVKLPTSGSAVLARPNAKPTGYGLGKAGWVSVTYAATDQPPLDEILAWIAESYRAVAPKKLARALSGP